jgi:hypothetical protein
MSMSCFDPSSTELTKFPSIGPSAATGFVAVDHTRKLVIISFRGTSNLHNILTDINIVMHKTADVCDGCRIHNGFHASWHQISSRVIAQVKDVHTRFPSYEVVVTGHSLGGAIANVAAASLRKHGHTVTLYTYGAPRTGNKAFSIYLDSFDASPTTPGVNGSGKVPVTKEGGGGLNYRFTHTDDPIPRVPPAILGYVQPYPNYHLTDNVVPVVLKAIQVIEDGKNQDKRDKDIIRKRDLNAHHLYFGNISACGPPHYKGRNVVLPVDQELALSAMERMAFA